MEQQQKTIITIEATVNAPVAKVWDYWNQPEHITQWAFASDDWHAPWAKNDLRAGGSFSSRMEAKDGSMGFDFGGVYDEVREHEYIEYTLGDGRKVTIQFDADGDTTQVTESFEAEGTHPADFQRAGWQAILDNFKKYTEAN
ncbi:MAG: SRPBCC family protein [Chitinophagaceae bacterium]